MARLENETVADVIPADLGSNRLVRGDNGELLNLWRERLRGEVDLVYVDPPFATGAGFSATVRVGEGGREVNVPVYQDRWPGKMAGYLTMLKRRFECIHDLLSARGALYVHLDYRAAARVRCLLDDIFGPRSFVNEIVWFYKTGGMPEKLGFGRKHDTILYFVKDPARAIWNPQKEKSYLTHRYGFSNVEIHQDERGPFTWVNCRDVFDIPALRGNQPERVDFPTQKPQALIERIMSASSHPGSLVADFFCGSGTSLVVAEKLGRRWLGCDVSAFAIHTARKRLLACPTLRPFTVSGDETRYTIRVAPRQTSEGWCLELLGVEPVADDPLPEEVRGMLERWSDRVDLWGIGWGPGRDLHMNWYAHRTRQQRALPLVSPATIPAGESLVVTVVDVLGHRSSVACAPIV